MAESPEYRTVVSCIKQLETALFRSDRDVVHFLNQEGFITQEVHDDVLNPRSMLTDHQKAGELVSWIRMKVELSAQNYHALVKHLGQSGKHYESIVDILDNEYSRQRQEIKVGKWFFVSYIITWYLNTYTIVQVMLYQHNKCISPWGLFRKCPMHFHATGST